MCCTRPEFTSVLDKRPEQGQSDKDQMPFSLRPYGAARAGEMLMSGYPFRVKSVRLGGLALLGALIMSMLASAAFAEAYRLGPGDRVRVQVAGIDNMLHAATVDETGRVRIPYLGTHTAAGLTLDQLNQNIALATAGEQLTVSRDGRERVVVLGERDIFIDIDAYRPVTVLGMVASPGRIAFEPGMRARTAIGMAGGIAFPRAETRFDQMLSQRTRLEELRQTEAWLVADLWRIDSLLSGAETGAPPEEYAEILRARMPQDDLDIIRQRIDYAREKLERDRDDIEARIALTLSRTDFLETAVAQYEISAASEQQRLENLQTLTERGFATANAIDTARLAAFNASSRVLTTQADLAGTERDLQSLRLSRDGLEDELRQRLLEDRLRIRQRLAELRVTQSGLRQALAVSAMMESDAEGASRSYRIVLHRRDGDEEISRDIAPGDALAPGDELEILLIE